MLFLIFIVAFIFKASAGSVVMWSCETTDLLRTVSSIQVSKIISPHFRTDSSTPADSTSKSGSVLPHGFCNFLVPVSSYSIRLMSFVSPISLYNFSHRNIYLPAPIKPPKPFFLLS